MFQRSAALFGAFLLAQLFAVPTAVAEEQRTTRDSMTITGFDRSVAKANGYEIITLPDGREASVKKSDARAAEAGDVRPMAEETLFGECGYSFVEIYGLGFGRVEYRTGFGVSPVPAVDFRWEYDVAWNSGGEVFSDGYPFAQPRSTWNTGLQYLTAPVGEEIGIWVSPIPSRPAYAVLENGGLCESLNPSATTVVR